MEFTTVTLALTKYSFAWAPKAAVTIDKEGGRIGRLEDCLWTLPVGSVSRVHAIVHWASGAFFITDKSSNGMMQNGQQVPFDQPVRLAEGDVLKISNYEILVSFDQHEAVQAVQREPSLGWGAHDETWQGQAAMIDGPPILSPLPVASGISSESSPAAIENSSPFEIPSPDVSEPAPSDSESGSFLHGLDALSGIGVDTSDVDSGNSGEQSDEHIEGFPQATLSEAELDWTSVSVPEADVQALPSDSPPRTEKEDKGAVKQTAPPVDAERVLRAFFDGAGVDAGDFAGEDPVVIAGRLGESFSASVVGMFGLLRARDFVKSSFRLQITQLRAADNNPLRLAPDIAKRKLLTNSDPSYLPAEQAFTKAFDDLKKHEMASLAGMRGAMMAFLAKFDPDTLEARFDSRMAGGRRLPGLGPDRWQQYRVEYTEKALAVQDKFHEVFGRDFERAYAEQLERLMEDDTEAK
jgi:type VI secretion system protein ImpI